MIIPQGGIWQELRALALGSIARSTPVTPYQPYSLSKWLAAGYYLCVSSTNRRLELDVSTFDIGAALLGDAEYFLDHAAEHKATALDLIRAADWSSSSWLLVTLYYWSYFSTLAISRLLGRTTWFLARPSLQTIARTGPQGARVPGAGAFILEVGAPISASDRRIELVRSDDRLHEAVWISLFRTLRAAVGAATLPRANVDEFEVYQTIFRSADRLGGAWPSDFRNAVNYRPGLAYDTVRGVDCLGLARWVRPPRTRSLADVIGMHAEALEELGRPPAAIDANPSAYARLLVTLGYVLDSLANDLHADLVDRHGLTPTWQSIRRKFNQRHSMEDWPIG